MSNILDIPMAPLTSQYLVYVEAMRARNMELAAEYLLMAAMLLEIKSRMLLPRPKRVEEAEEGEDPRAELVRRLIEYEQMKAAAPSSMPCRRRCANYEWVGFWITDAAVEPLPEVNLHDLQVAWLSLMKHAKVMQHHKVTARGAFGARAHEHRPAQAAGCGAFLEFASCST
jgi:segregation and condensation protein A